MVTFKKKYFSAFDRILKLGNKTFRANFLLDLAETFRIYSVFYNASYQLGKYEKCNALTDALLAS